jgi:multicomponent Na+:H+ antiporter subunit A
MEQLIELLKQIKELAGVGVDALEGAAKKGGGEGGDKPAEGGAPHEGAPAEGGAPREGGAPHEGAPAEGGGPRRY